MIKLSKEIPNEILSSIQLNLDNIMKDIHTDINNNDLLIKTERQKIDDLIPLKEKKDFEDIIKEMKLRELEGNKASIQKKLNKLEENLKILTLDQLGSNSSNFNTSMTNDKGNINIVEENIKKAQLKVIKDAKEILIHKLNGINEQVEKLMSDEEQLCQTKKLNIKQFLDNFEKDKEVIQQRAHKYEEEMRLREYKMISSITKAKEKKEKELDTMEKEEEEKRKKTLEKIRLRELERIRERAKENSEKVNFLKSHVNNKPAKENEYLFKVLENEYKIKEENEIKKEIMRHKNKMKEGIVSLEEIIEFARRQKEAEIIREVEVDEERRKLREQWKMTEEILPKYESSIMQKIKEEDQRDKEQKELEEFKKKIKIKEIKNYSEAVSKMFLPKIDENAKKEREDRIKNLTIKNNIQPHKRKNNRIILVKPDPNKPRKYKWETKLSPLDEQNENHNNNKMARARSAKHKIPLEKKPDYLTELRIKKSQNERVSNSSHGKDQSKHWEKMIKNDKNTLMENVEMIKIQAEKLEEQAKMKEKLLQANKGINVAMQENVSSMLIDAIKAKLTILENISPNKK